MTCEEFTGQPCTCPQPSCENRPPSASGFKVAPGPFRIYRNVNKHCWSVQHRPGMGLQGWRVMDHRQALVVLDATFKVSEAGRQRVIREGRKNVHAYICTPAILGTEDVLDSLVEITYHPYSAGTFVTIDGQPITSARAVVLATNGRAFAHQPN